MNKDEKKTVQIALTLWFRELYFSESFAGGR